MRDPLIYQTPDGGEINISDGIVETTDGLETAVYLSLFGGQDLGGEWWGNGIQPDRSYKYQSEFAKLSNNIALTPFNLRRLEEAAKSDLAELPSSNIEVTASINNIDELLLTVKIDESTMEYTENWEAMRDK